jgi:hypothetical protein
MATTLKTMGFIYCVWYTVTRCFKLGWARRTKARLKMAQTWVAEPFVLMFEIPGTMDSEKAIHRKLRRRGYSKGQLKGTEIYHISDSELVTRARLGEIIDLSVREDGWQQQALPFSMIEEEAA